MSTIYPYIQIIHLFCSIIFVGYLFFDVVIFTIAKKKLSKECATAADASIHSIGVKIMPACVLLLVLTGGMMMSTWVGSNAGGYFATDLQKVFMVKVILALIIFFTIAISLVFKYILKKKGPFGNIHPFALVVSVIIIFLAKYMFFI